MLEDGGCSKCDKIDGCPGSVLLLPALALLSDREPGGQVEPLLLLVIVCQIVIDNSAI